MFIGTLFTHIVSTVRQFWKLGAAVREPGARTRRVRAEALVRYCRH